jgi:maleylpyruvate isomerase
MATVELGQALAWMKSGSVCFEAGVDALTDEDLLASSPLPGWTRAHIVSHVVRNAGALGNLLTWARTGIETPMYDDWSNRDRDINAGARRNAIELRSDVLASNRHLAASVEDMTHASWHARVRTAHGRVIPAAEVPWLRVRELWIHRVDLDPGAAVRLPEDLVDVLLREVLGRFSDLAGVPSLRLDIVDRATPVLLGMPAQDAIPVRGEAQAILFWLIGRGASDAVVSEHDDLPTLPPWL